jgi:hypothetical protein
LKPAIIDYAVEEFRRQLNEAISNLSAEVAEQSARKAQLEFELRRIVDAIAAQGHSDVLLKAVADREAELREMTPWLTSERQGRMTEDVSQIRRFVTDGLSNLPDLLNKDVAVARAELGKHITEIRMVPNLRERYYTAIGSWSLLGRCPATSPTHQYFDVRVRMVAGAGFEPATFGL